MIPVLLHHVSRNHQLNELAIGTEILLDGIVSGTNNSELGKRNKELGDGVHTPLVRSIEGEL